jgi:hypothetical protein
VRNVGYKAVRPARGRSAAAEGDASDEQMAGGDTREATPAGAMSPSLPGQ